MGLAFPSNPVVGAVFRANNISWVWDGVRWDALVQGGEFLPSSGGTMEGQLLLARDPVEPMEATTRRYFDGVFHGFVNKIRNPCFDLWQRGDGPFGTSVSEIYSADGWRVQRAGVSNTTVSRGGALGSALSSLIFNGAASSNAAASIRHRIESSVAAPLAGKRCTLQCLLRNDSGVTLPAGQDGPYFSAVFPSAQADDWSGQAVEPEMYNFPPYSIFSPVLTPIASGETRRLAFTWNVSLNAVRGYGIWFSLNHPELNGAGRSLTVSEFDFRETPGWPVGPCANPPPTEIRPIPIELTFCQRYFETTYQNEAPGTATWTGAVRHYYATPAAAGNRVATLFWPFKVRKRVSPTVTVYSASGTAGNVSQWGPVNAAATGLSVNEHAYACYATVPGAAVQNFNFGANFIASAEL